MPTKIKKNRFESFKNGLEKLPGYIVSAIAVLLILSLYGSISKIREVNIKIDKERQVLQRLKEENETLQKDLEKARSEEFLEKQLRDKLGMAREGEIVVILPETETVKRFAPIIEEERKLPPDPNWKKWLKLFL